MLCNRSAYVTLLQQLCPVTSQEEAPRLPDLAVLVVTIISKRIAMVVYIPKLETHLELLGWELTIDDA